MDELTNTTEPQIAYSGECLWRFFQLLRLKNGLKKN